MKYFRHLSLAALVGVALLSAWGCGGSSSGSSSASTATNTNPVILSPATGAVLPDAEVGTAYVETFTVVSGGTAPYSFNANGVPGGLSFAAVTTFTMTLSGTPTTAGSGSSRSSSPTRPGP